MVSNSICREMKYLVITFLSLITLSNAFPNPQDDEEVSLDYLSGMYIKVQTLYLCIHIRNGTIAVEIYSI